MQNSKWIQQIAETYRKMVAEGAATPDVTIGAEPEVTPEAKNLGNAYRSGALEAAAKAEMAERLRQKKNIKPANILLGARQRVDPNPPELIRRPDDYDTNYTDK